MKSTFADCSPVSGGDCIALGREPELNVVVFSCVEVSLYNLIL